MTYTERLEKLLAAGMMDDADEFRRCVDGALREARASALDKVRRMALEVELCAPWQDERARTGFKAGWEEVFMRIAQSAVTP